MDHMAFSPSRHDLAGQAKRLNLPPYAAAPARVSPTASLMLPLWVNPRYFNWHEPAGIGAVDQQQE
jgi:hypothetical protein